MMKQGDFVKMARLEFRYGKGEWFFSLLMQVCTLVCVLLCMSLFTGFGRIGSDFLKCVLSEDSFSFQMVNYTRDDQEAMEKMGFYDFFYDEEGNC